MDGYLVIQHSRKINTPRCVCNCVTSSASPSNENGTRIFKNTTEKAMTQSTWKNIFGSTTGKIAIPSKTTPKAVIDITTLPSEQGNVTLKSVRRRAADSNREVPLSLSSNSVVNPHNYEFIIANPYICKRSDIVLVTLFFTTYDETVFRGTMRKISSSGTSVVLGRKVVGIFLLGSSGNATVDAMVEKESKEYGDIVQESYLDTHGNRTLKMIMGFRWVSTYCAHAQYVMKVESHVIVNYDSLMRRLEQAPMSVFAEGTVLCCERPVSEDNTTKWYTSPVPSPKTYPPYLEGSAYVMSSDVSRGVFSMSPFVRYLSFDDVYVGIVMKTLGVIPVQGQGYDSPSWRSWNENEVTYLCRLGRSHTLKIRRSRNNPRYEQKQFLKLHQRLSLSNLTDRC
uniref:Hexosyltransferase n=1 Tax=Saccoglossus kowalevskii TaxID=10224 RepID=A0ABM0MWR7_SACKO|nr:PREDICTED: beta-1,3-galactosyltransferase 1-like [Saccoglossus kowalevskii]